MRAPRLSVLVAATLSLLLAFSAVPRLRAQVSAEEQRKRELFLRARESIQPAPAATPQAEPVRPKPRPRPTAPPLEKPLETIKLPPPAATPSAPAPKAKATPPPKTEPPPRPTATPPPAREQVDEGKTAPPEKITSDYKLPPPRDAGEIRLPPPQPTATPAPPDKEDEIKLPPPQPLPSPQLSPQEAAGEEGAPAAPIVVEKSGLEEDQGLEPAPKPERRGLFGMGGPRYRYLTRAVRAAIDRAPVKRGRWQYIVVHNSGTRQGNARIFANYHKNVRGMQNGLAYHFVIGNGTSSGNGEIEIGPRWTRQINGGHVASDYLNNIALGVCFVGDFNRDTPTSAQLGALEELIRYLRNRVGKSKGRVVIVKAHREINPKPTDCPGDRFPYRWLHRRFN